MTRHERGPAMPQRGRPNGAPAGRRTGILSILAGGVVMLSVLAVATTCRRGDNVAVTTSGESGTAASGDSAATPATAVFNSAQVEHGGIRWAAVTAGGAATMIELPGQLVPNEDRTSRLGAPAQGRIVSVPVRPGEAVARGQALVTLQSPAASAARADFEKAVAAVASHRAAASYARSARSRAERLLAIKAASQQESERAAADDELAQAELRQAEAEAGRARATLTQLGVGTESGVMVLRSPIAGIVLSRDAVPGTVTEAGTPLVTITDLASLWLELSAPDAAVQSLRTGARVRFSVPAFPSDTFEGRVQSIGGGLDPTTRTIPIRAVVANAAGKLRPAMFATTWLETGTSRSALLVPDAAVQLLDDIQVVFVARPDGTGGARFEYRVVTATPAGGGRTQVAGALAPGELVVVAGAFAVKSQFARSKMAGG